MLPDSLGNYTSAAGQFSARCFGSFGETGPYTDLRTGAPVVLKLLELGETERSLPPEIKTDPTFPQFSHDRDPQSGRHFYTTNFVRTQPLGGTGYAERRQAAIDAARALARLPAHHGLLTEHDVVRQAGGGVLILDTGFGFDPEGFSVARLGSDGRAAYLAPEQLKKLQAGQAAPPSPRADVYSFGLILYKLFAGSFPASQTGSAGWSLQKSDLDALQAPRSLGPLLLSCCQADPAQRPRSVEALLGSLERLPARYTPRPPGPGFGRRLLGRFVKLALLLIVLLVAGFFANRHGLDRKIAPAVADRVDNWLIELGLKTRLAWAADNPDFVRASLPLELGGQGLDELDFALNGRSVQPRIEAQSVTFDAASDASARWNIVARHRLDGRELRAELPVHERPRLDPLHRAADDEQPVSKHGEALLVQLAGCYDEPSFFWTVGRVEQALEAIRTDTDSATIRSYTLAIPAQVPRAAEAFELFARVDGQSSNRLRCRYLQPEPKVAAVSEEAADILVFGSDLRDEQDWVRVHFTMDDGSEYMEVGSVDAQGQVVRVSELALSGRGQVVVEVGELASPTFPFDIKQKQAVILEVDPLPAAGGSVRVRGLFLVGDAASKAVWRTGEERAELPVQWQPDGREARVEFPPGRGGGELVLQTTFGTTTPFGLEYARPQGLGSLSWRPDPVRPGESLELIGCESLSGLRSAGLELAFEGSAAGYLLRFPTLHPGESTAELELLGPWGSASRSLALAYDPLLLALLEFETAVREGAEVAMVSAGSGWLGAWSAFQAAYLDYDREQGEDASGSPLIRADIVDRMAALCRQAELPRALRAEAGYIAGWCASQGWADTGHALWPEVATIFAQLATLDLPEVLASFVATRLELLHREE